MIVRRLNFISLGGVTATRDGEASPRCLLARRWSLDLRWPHHRARLESPARAPHKRLQLNLKSSTV